MIDAEIRLKCLKPTFAILFVDVVDKYSDHRCEHRKFGYCMIRGFCEWKEKEPLCGLEWLANHLGDNTNFEPEIKITIEGKNTILKGDRTKKDYRDVFKSLQW
jgi:hypothetical protein